MSVIASLAGKWTEVSVENFEEFMKALDVGFLTRKVGNHTKGNEEWIQEGDKVILHLTNTFKNKSLTFKLDEEIDEETLDGRKMKTTFTEKDGKLVHRQVGKPHNCTYIRELEGDNLLVVTMTVEAPTPVTAVRKFKRVEK